MRIETYEMQQDKAVSFETDRQLELDASELDFYLFNREARMDEVCRKVAVDRFGNGKEFQQERARKEIFMNKAVLITGTSTGFGRTAAETLA